MSSLKRYREQILMSNAELAQKTGLSIATIDRIEKGKKCHLTTRKKIMLGVGVKASEEHKIFGIKD